MTKGLESNINAQLELCQKLEDLADQLPDDVNISDCQELAQEISPIIKKVHEFEETALFPCLRKSFSHDQNLMATLERLRFEHWEDESYADELQEGMMQFAARQDEECKSSLPYMLRGFFEGVRRHAAFEREHILPILMKSEL